MGHCASIRGRKKNQGVRLKRHIVTGGAQRKLVEHNGYQGTLEQ
jgi:hypothetical protein